MTKKKWQPLRWHQQQWLWRWPRQRKAMADATSVNCNGKRIYGDNNGDSTTATVMAMMKATATATATAMAKAMVAMWWQWQWRRQRRRWWRRLKSQCLVWLWCGVLWCWYMLYYCDPVTSGMWIRRKIFTKFFLLHVLGTSTNVLCGFCSRCFCWTCGMRLTYIIGNSQYHCSLWWPCWTLIKSKTCVHYWEFIVPLFLVSMFVHWTLIKSCTKNELWKFCQLDLFLNCFSSVALSLFFQANHTKQQKIITARPSWQRRHQARPPAMPHQSRQTPVSWL